MVIVNRRPLDYTPDPPPDPPRLTITMCPPPVLDGKTNACGGTWMVNRRPLVAGLLTLLV